MLGGCGGTMAPNAPGVAEDDFAHAIVRVHERAVQVRAADPAAVGTAPGDDLARILTRGNLGSVVSTEPDSDRAEVVTAAGVRVE